MIGIFGDQHMRDRGLRRKPRLDQACGSRSLNDAIGAGAARIFGATGDDDAELRRDHVQPLGHILANAMQATAAGADQTFRLDDLFDTRKMAGKRTSIDRAWPGVLLSQRANVQRRKEGYTVMEDPEGNQFCFVPIRR